MPRTTKAISSNKPHEQQTAEDNGCYRLMQFIDDRIDENCYIVWSRKWLPERIHKRFLTRSFLCKPCAIYPIVGGTSMSSEVRSR